MKRNILLLTVIVFLCSSLPAFAQSPLWSRTYGDSTANIGNSVQQTTDGGYIVVGTTDFFSAGGSGSDVYLIKTNSLGDTLWSRTYGGSNNDYGYSVQQTTDGGYIVAGKTTSFGTVNGDVYLIKTNSSGALQWSCTYGGSSYDEGASVQQTTDGGYIVAGKTTLSDPMYDVYLIKINANGGIQWSRTYGGNDYDWSSSVQQTTDGGYIVVGWTLSFNIGSNEVYLIKTDANGNLLWSRTYGGSVGDFGYSVQQTTDGGYIVAGLTYSFGPGPSSVYLIKTDSLGDTLWTRTYGGSSHDIGNSVQQTTDGGYIVAGYTESFGAGNEDVYLIKTDTNGDTLWSRVYGDSADDRGWSLQQTTDGGYIVAGGTSSFGAGHYDVMLTKLDSLGNTCIGEFVSSTVLNVSSTVTSPPTEVSSPPTEAMSPNTIVTSPPTQVTTVCEEFPPVECEIPNGSFEEGQLGQFPPDWVKETECIGPGATCVHEAWTVNTRYYQGSRSLYMHSRVVDGGTAASYTSNTTAWTADWHNCPDAVSVKFHIRDIVTTHSTYWGWNTFIYVCFTDGVNSACIRVYQNGETVNYHDYCDIVTGADGSSWFMYNVAIPATIDKTHMKIGIRDVVGCWTWYGYYSDLKFYVDMVELIMCGDVNADGVINVGDVVYLINYLYRGGPPPCPVELAECNCDGVVNIGDVVYLIAYLYKGGPEPGDCKAAMSPGSPSGLYKGRTPAQIGFSSPTRSKDGVWETSVMCRTGVDIGGVQLEIKYDPEETYLLEPSLTPKTGNLKIYSFTDDGIQKIGVLDPSGEQCIPAGTCALVTLRVKGSDLNGLTITEIILVDRDAREIPVQIVSEVKESEERLAAEKPAIPQEFSLCQNYPNPFNPETEISYVLPSACHVELFVYNLLGQRVRTLVDEFQAAGQKAAHWDGTDKEGGKVASGIYFYRIQAGEFADTRKMILMK